MIKEIRMMTNSAFDLLEFKDGTKVRRGWYAENDPCGVTRSSSVLIEVPPNYAPRQLDDNWNPIGEDTLKPITTIDRLIDLLFEKELKHHE